MQLSNGPPQQTATPQISHKTEKPTQLFPNNPPSTNLQPYIPQLSKPPSNDSKIIPVSTNGHQNDIDDSKSDVSDLTLPTFDGTYDARSNSTADRYFDTIHKYFDILDIYEDKDKATALPPDVYVEDVEDEEDKKPVEAQKSESKNDLPQPVNIPQPKENNAVEDEDEEAVKEALNGKLVGRTLKQGQKMDDIYTHYFDTLFPLIKSKKTKAKYKKGDMKFEGAHPNKKKTILATLRKDYKDENGIA